MKRTMFNFLLVVMPFCKAADPYASWNQAVQNIPNWQQEQVLDLRNNQITAIPDNFNAPQLEVLDLRNNQIAAIPDNFNAPRLEVLALRNNQIVAIPDTFNPPRLEVLDLRNNQIAAIPDNFNFPQLEMLDLSNNQIGYIDPYVLDRLPSLNRLHLSNNPIYEGGSDGVNALRDYAEQHYPDLVIITDNILQGDPPGINIKGDPCE